MPSKSDKFTQFMIAALLVALAVLRAVKHDQLADRMDNLFFILIGVAVILIVIPIDRLRSLKAGGVEVSLDQPQVQGAISALGLENVQNEKLRVRLEGLSNELASAQGSRILWIDDRPNNLLGERRLFRALGMRVDSAISSEVAEKMLEADSDFDVLVTDVQRLGNSHEFNKGVEIHEGVNFIVKLREGGVNSAIASMPVVFYAAYDWPRLMEFTRPARELQPEADVANTIVDLVPKVVARLAEVRRQPIVTSESKEPTTPRSPAN